MKKFDVGRIYERDRGGEGDKGDKGDQGDKVRILDVKSEMFYEKNTEKTYFKTTYFYEDGTTDTTYTPIDSYAEYIDLVQYVYPVSEEIPVLQLRTSGIGEYVILIEDDWYWITLFDNGVAEIDGDAGNYEKVDDIYYIDIEGMGYYEPFVLDEESESALVPYEVDLSQEPDKAYYAMVDGKEAYVLIYGDVVALVSVYYEEGEEFGAFEIELTLLGMAV